MNAAGDRATKEKQKRDERRQREEPHELTFDERLKKAQGAKERAENPRYYERGDASDNRGERGGRGRGRGYGRGTATGTQRPPRSDNGGNEVCFAVFCNIIW